jgi:Fe2+ transport system protein FeoA
VKCQLCGLEYQEQDGRASCAGCAMSSGCGLVKCPNCGYENPKEPSLYRLLARRKDKMKASAALSARDETAVSDIASLRKGMRGQIARIDQTNKTRLRKLLVMGLLPGVHVELLQRFPSYLVKAGHTQIAIDNEMARGIYVRTDHAPRKGAPPMMRSFAQFVDSIRRWPVFAFAWKEAENAACREPSEPEKCQSSLPHVFEPPRKSPAFDK